ncbi:MAG: hypothetical protein HXY50_00870 [Ignavibacteriaceae bacterium]|nr:hypothetical protein [Ignavibacteriaceae bacterium]
MHSSTMIRYLLYAIKFLGLILSIIIAASITSIILNRSLLIKFTDEGLKEFISIFLLPISLSVVLIVLITLYLSIRRLQQNEQQLNLLKKHMEAAEKPEIYIDEIELTVLTKIERDNEVRIIITKEDLINEPLNFRIFNVGTGSAVHCKFTFEFDLFSILKSIKTLNHKLNWFEIYRIDKESQRLELRNSKYQITINDREFTFSDFKNFILPSSRETKISRIPFTNLYLELFIIYTGLILFEHREFDIPGLFSKNEDVKKFPKLLLNMNYKDIGGNEKNKNFEIVIETHKFSNPFWGGKFRETKNVFKMKVVPIKWKEKE